jgi:gluconate 2-dehydrogenase gamma chain
MRTVTRRGFLAGTAAASVLCVGGCSRRNSSRWEFLSDVQAGTLAALSDQIIPEDDFPSASQAGVVVYIDRQLMGPYHRHREAYQAGLEDADGISREICGAALAQAPPAIQQRVASALAERSRAFFELVRAHTMEGYYGSPRHGGNRDAVSWRMLGLPEPPLRGRAHYDLGKGTGS